MRKIFSMALACVMMAVLSGCGKSEGEKLMSDTISKLKEEVAALKSATNEATAKEAGVKVKAITDEMVKNAANAAKSDTKVSEDDAKKLMEKYKPEMDEVNKQIQTETTRITSDAKMGPAYMSGLMGTK